MNERTYNTLLVLPRASDYIKVPREEWRRCLESQPRECRRLRWYDHSDGTVEYHVYDPVRKLWLE